MSYPHVKLTSISLSWTQLLLANTIIQVNKLYIREPNIFQNALALTVERTKYNTKPGQSATITITDSEKKVMRDYNLNYCCILVDNMKKFEAQDDDRAAQGLETYKIATELHRLFGPEPEPPISQM